MAAPINRVVAALRSGLLELTPGGIGLAPTEELPNVWGAFFDEGVGGDVLMVNGLADQTSSVYTSSGRAVIGTGYLPAVHAATVVLLVAIEDALPAFAPSDALELPEEGFVAFTALTFGGRRRAVAQRGEVAAEDHPLAAVWSAGHTLSEQLAIATLIVTGPDFHEVAGHAIVTLNADPPA